jgi:hypothetical protein
MSTVVLANWLTNRYGLVPIGFGLLVTAGTFAAALSLIGRDWVQTATNRRWAVPVLILAAALLSAVVASPALAVASGLAFLVSELVDWSVFTPLRDRSLPLAVVVSSLVAAPVDTVLFLQVAGFPVTIAAVAGQVLVKTGLALLVGFALTARRDPVPA